MIDFVLEQTDVTALPVCRQGNDVGLCSLGLLVVVSTVGGAGCCELLVLGAGTLGCCGLVELLVLVSCLVLGVLDRSGSRFGTWTKSIKHFALLWRCTVTCVGINHGGVAVEPLVLGRHGL